MDRLLITTSSFGAGGGKIYEYLESKGFEVVLNPFSRKITEKELHSLLDENKPVGLIAGTEPITQEVIHRASAFLKVISRVGVGWDNVDHNAAEKYGVSVFRTPDAVTRPVVELTVGLFLDLARHVSQQDRALRHGVWEKQMGNLILGKSLCVIGCGRIGQEVALVMKGLGCKVNALDPCHDVKWHEENNIPLLNSVEEAFKVSDLISIHTSMPENCFHLITKTHFELARPNLLLVNVARGGIIDETALVDALNNGRIAGAALDVFEKEPYMGPLCECDNTILTPHIGSYAKESRVQMEKEAVENLLKGLSRA